MIDAYRTGQGVQINIGRIHVGFFSKGNCWEWKLSRRDHHYGKMRWYTFWRFYLNVDHRCSDGAK